MGKRMQKLKRTNINFFNRIARYYDLPIFSNWLNKPQKEILNFIDFNKTSKILDVGFGTGNFLKLLYENNNRHKIELYGIDISRKMMEIAKRKLKNKARLKISSVDEMDFKNNSFDYVFSTEAFHHFSDQKFAVKKMYRVLRKGGSLIIVDLDFGKILNNIFHKIEPGNSKMNSMEDFKKLFKENKFNNIKQKRVGWFFIVTKGVK